MKERSVIIMVAAGALLAAGAAAFLANGYIQTSVDSQVAALKQDHQPVRVVVANQDLARGAFLSAQTVAIREIPKAYLSAQAILEEAWGSVEGRVLATPVRSGEPILSVHLVQNIGAGFSALLKTGQRALTLPVDEQSSIAGLLQPGDHVDLMFTTTRGSDSVTTPLLSAVTVLATGVRTLTNDSQLADSARNAGYSTVTVAVSPQEAARITFAQQSGRISVLLRERDDVRETQLVDVTKDSLLRIEKRPAGVRSPSVEIIVGGQ